MYIKSIKNIFNPKKYVVSTNFESSHICRSFVILGITLCLALWEPAFADGGLLFEDGFDYPDGEVPEIYWSEGHASVTIKDERLLLDAMSVKGSNGATVWLNRNFEGNVRVEFDAHVIESIDKANNINFFLFFSDPSGIELYDTRGERSDGVYPRYHCPTEQAHGYCNGRKLEGYIFTFVGNGNERKARFRLRDVPGFNLLSENNTYENKKGKTYKIVVIKEDAKLMYLVDGVVQLCHIDTEFNPVYTQGKLGFRTWKTFLWFDNLKVFSLGDNLIEKPYRCY